MKVNGPNSVGGASAPRRKKSAKPAGFEPSPSAPAGAGARTSAIQSASAIGSVGALLALQAGGEPLAARQRMTERAMSMLDVLDDLKIALLEGGLPREKLTTLMTLLRSRREAVDDPELAAALDEVETRAAVELAKFDA